MQTSLCITTLQEIAICVLTFLDIVPHGGIGVRTSLATKWTHQHYPVMYMHVVHHCLTIGKGFVAPGTSLSGGQMESTITISDLLGVDGTNPFRVQVTLNYPQD